MHKLLFPPARLLLLIVTLFLPISLSSFINESTGDDGIKPGVSSNRLPLVTANSLLRSRTDRPLTNDPIRFAITANKQRISVGEEVELSITARLMTIPSNLMFFLPGSNAYTLKMLLPTGFQQTGGDLTEFVTGELTQSGRVEATYTVRGYFTSMTPNACFRLLRSHGQANNQSLFVEKATFCLPVYSVDKPDASRIATTNSSLNWCVEAESGSGNRGVESNPQASGGQVVGGFGNSGEYMDYTIGGVSDGGSYTLHLWYTSGETPQFGIVVNGNLQTTSGTSNGSWTGPFVEKTVTVNLQAGTNSLRIQGAGGSFALDRLCVDGGGSGGGCTPPSLSLASPVCAGNNVYSVNFSAQAGASVSSSAGSVQGNQVVNIPTGVNATITASLNGCSSQQIAYSPTCSSGGGGSLVSGNCYVIKSQQTSSVNNTLQAIGTQALFRTTNGQNDQIWKAESAGSSYRFTSQAGNRDQVLYVDGLSDGQPLKLGGYVANERYHWNLATSSQSGYRIYGGSNQNTWDQQGAGSGDLLQLYGTNINASDFHWDKPYRRFSFHSVGCPITACSPPSLSLGTPTCSGNTTYYVSFSTQAGATITASTGSVQGNQVVNIPVGTPVTITASLSGCSSQQTANSPTCTSGGNPSGCGTGSGLTGFYTNTTDLSTNLVAIRTDSKIDFAWGNDSPMTSVVNADGFSVRWYGQVEAPVSGVYTFKTNNDDGTRLWVNDQLLIDDWNGHPPTWKQGSIYLNAGQKYPIEMVFVDYGGGAQAQLYWEYPGQSTQIVPSCRLYTSFSPTEYTFEPITSAPLPYGYCSVSINYLTFFLECYSGKVVDYVVYNPPPDEPEEPIDPIFHPGPKYPTLPAGTGGGNGLPPGPWHNPGLPPIPVLIQTGLPLLAITLNKFYASMWYRGIQFTADEKAVLNRYPQLIYSEAV